MRSTVETSLGQLVQNEQHEHWHEVSLVTPLGSIAFTLMSDDSPLADVIAFAEKVVSQLESVVTAAKARVASDLLELKNSTWLE